MLSYFHRHWQLQSWLDHFSWAAVSVASSRSIPHRIDWVRERRPTSIEVWTSVFIRLSQETGKTDLLCFCGYVIASSQSWTTSGVYGGLKLVQGRMFGNMLGSWSIICVDASLHYLREGKPLFAFSRVTLKGTQTSVGTTNARTTNIRKVEPQNDKRRNDKQRQYDFLF